MSTPAPPSSSSPMNDPMLGHCEFLNASLMLQLFVLLVTLISAGITAVVSSRGLKPGKVDYGKPWVLINLMWAVSFWGIAPIVTFFIFWHEGLPASFSHVSAMACIVDSQFPAMQIFCLFVGFLVVAIYNPRPGAKTWGTLAAAEIQRALTQMEEGGSPSSPSSAPGPKIETLMLSSIANGMLYVELLDAASRNPAVKGQASCSLVDMANARPTIVHNANALGVDTNRCRFISQGPEQPNIDSATLLSAAQPFALDASDATYNFLIIPTGIRLQSNLGGFMASPEDMLRRLRAVLVEVYRVLVPGASVVIIDSAENILFTRVDMEAVGFEMEQPVPLGQGYSTWTCSSRQLFVCRGRRPSTTGEKGNHQELQNACLSTQFQFHSEGADDRHMAAASSTTAAIAIPLDGQGRSTVSDTTAWTFTVLYQLLMFCVLSLLAAAVYEPLNIPKSLTIGQRVGNIFPAFACNYPMMSYFTRTFFLKAQSFRSVGHLVCKVMTVDTLALIASLLFSGLFFLPPFVLELALSATSLSSGTKALIGMVASFVIGTSSAHIQRHFAKLKKYKLYGLVFDDVQSLERQAKRFNPTSAEDGNSPSAPLKGN